MKIKFILLILFLLVPLEMAFSKNVLGVDDTLDASGEISSIIADNSNKFGLRILQINLDNYLTIKCYLDVENIDGEPFADVDNLILDAEIDAIGIKPDNKNRILTLIANSKDNSK